MTADAGMMDQHENVRGAFTRSVFFHLALVGGLTFWAWWNGPGESFGDDNPGGAAVGVTAVDTIPLPSRGRTNPVASDTESEVPQEVAKPAPKEAPEPEPEDAVALLPPDRKSKQPLTPKSRLKTFEEIAQNQVTSKSPQAASSPLFTQAGAAQINNGVDAALGRRFPEYAAQIKELTRTRWRVQDVDRSVTTAPSVTIRYDILKNGSVANVRFVRRSNIPSLDLSVQNAVENQYPPLPAGYEKDSVPVEFTFELKR